MSTIIAFVSDNSKPMEAEEMREKLNKDCPRLLQPGERVLLAFKDRGGKGRDDSAWTDYRIIIRDKQGVSGKKVKYTSIPYHSIKAYSVETAGSFDSDSELKIMHSEGRTYKVDFVANSTDIMALKRFLNEMVLVPAFDKETKPNIAEEYSASVPEGTDTGGNVLDWMLSDATQIDAGLVQQQLGPGGNVHVLLPNEKVEMAFKCGRDSFICTSHRLLQIDVQGLSGKRVEYMSVLWKCIKAFGAETAGSFLDRDSELVLYTNVYGVGGSHLGGNFPSQTRIEIDFKKGSADIVAVQRFFANKILGYDTADTFVDTYGGNLGSAIDGGGSLGNILAFLGDDNKQIDAAAMNSQFHQNPPILQNDERVEMAFKGRRDILLLTNKRMLEVDVKGFSGKRVEYFSLPWKNVTLYSVCSAGSLDKDSEMRFWTSINDVWWPPKPDEESPPPPPIPRKSFIEIDFARNRVDLLALQRYLSARCLSDVRTGELLSSDIPVSPDFTQASPSNAMSSLAEWIGNDARALDPAAVDAQLHSPDTPVLLPDENVVLAYQAGRDKMLFTNRRAIIIDTQGFTGKRVEYLSIPYHGIRAFAVESAGSFDTDAEVKLYCGTYWMESPGSTIKQDFRKGKADILSIQGLLAAQIIGGDDGSPAIGFSTAGEVTSTPGSGSALLSWVTGDGVEISNEVVIQKLRDETPILQSDESVETCYQVGRDMIIYTSKRILFVDRQGISGKRVEYKTYPLRYCKGFSIKSAGMGPLSENKAKVYVDIPGASTVDQEMKKGTDFWNVHTLLAGKILGQK